MFYIQTQDGDLPYVYRVYERETNARKAALGFMRKHPENGMVYVATGLHEVVTGFIRQEDNGPIVEERRNPDDPYADPEMIEVA